eukprot:TRINITY_DN42408_c0_g1_i1.p1 TRINITY_DN42408_c0_g1~~TRINITY_DN42408_c0_g1_i1.p1  ORF type:complete len:363 (+),score=43.44 TRINITY_DN42408_c0_g1_i1:84-1172(+)
MVDAERMQHGQGESDAFSEVLGYFDEAVRDLMSILRNGLAELTPAAAHFANQHASSTPHRLVPRERAPKELIQVDMATEMQVRSCLDTLLVSHEVRIRQDERSRSQEKIRQEARRWERRLACMVQSRDEALLALTGLRAASLAAEKCRQENEGHEAAGRCREEVAVLHEWLRRTPHGTVNAGGPVGSVGTVTPSLKLLPFETAPSVRVEAAARVSEKTDSPARERGAQSLWTRAIDNQILSCTAKPPSRPVGRMAIRTSEKTDSPRERITDAARRPGGDKSKVNGVRLAPSPRGERANRTSETTDVLTPPVPNASISPVSTLPQEKAEARAHFPIGKLLAKDSGGGPLLSDLSRDGAAAKVF